MTLHEWCKENNNSALLDEWNYKKNKPLTPKDVTIGSSRLFLWEKTYYDKKTERTFVFEWNDSIHHRIRGRGCPYLSGKRVMVGFNDLATTNPEILIEWNSEKNNELQPISVTAGSHKQVWWKCARGHEWKASIKDKVHYHTSCPICSREIKTSFPEQALFYYINKHFKDAVNGDMHLGVELDIYIPSRRIAIEYDGYNWHKKDSQVRRDLKKNTVCANNDISLLRIREDGLRHLESCTEIFIERDVSDASLTRVIGSVLKHLGISNCEVSLRNDRADILKSYIVREKEKSLSKLSPSIADEWHPQKNQGLTPEQFSNCSSRVVWWLGTCGHEWTDSIKHRTVMNTGCPYCSGKKVLSGFNDLESQYPQLALEWDYKMNGNLKPDSITCGSDKKVWWKCKNGHRWQSRVPDRVKGNGCPYCANDYVWIGYNDLLSKNPLLAEEWHPTKNGGLSADCLVSGSNQKVWWLGKCRHEWQASVANRAKGQGCPYCSGRRILPGFNDLQTTNPKLSAQWHPTKNIGLWCTPCQGQL